MPKTTLVNPINGYYGNYEGEIMFDSIELRNLDVEKISDIFVCTKKYLTTSWIDYSHEWCRHIS